MRRIVPAGKPLRSQTAQPVKGGPVDLTGIVPASDGELMPNGKNAGKRADYDKQIDRLVPGVRIDIREGYHQFHLACAKGCPETLVYRTRILLPVDVIASKIANMGWRLGSKSVCPNHHEREKPMPANDAHTAIAIVPKPPSMDARAARRDALAWLDEAFNIEQGRFRAGVSDETIGKEVGLSADAVAQLREEFYGPIKRPAEYDAIKAEVDDMVNAADKIRHDIDKLGSEIGTARAQLAGLNKLLDAVSRKITAWGDPS